MSVLVGKSQQSQYIGVRVMMATSALVAASFTNLLATRAMAGLSCSVFSTAVGGAIGYIYTVGTAPPPAIAMLIGAALCGTGVGPMVPEEGDF
ncbi:hypothetical protein QBC33DRAFT_593326 [Phialemonium atrogriseum]|uniref:Uncharacterized protein n=1 Tax=Phialemonium atrogriseum TaxID=1093897 RepID=A0AAJ0FK74_9PEZI|nr:uncharacterized protein QBC33DRAFT_593326 [Phialemonium atrogriseum]KAK1765254.1 hypothetical protein QBC33DRAFT_593326 [Phialemonium atrogriseum]